jgi:hypothetical protein
LIGKGPMKYHISITDTQQLISFMALLDCGATGLFVNKGFVDWNKITTRTLTCPIPVYNIDGTRNEAGSICEVVDVILRYKDHSEWVQFAVTGLGKQDAILGYTWLKNHNSEVDWITKEVKMSRCPSCCSTCRTEIKQERHQRQMEARRHDSVIYSRSERPAQSVHWHAPSVPANLGRRYASAYGPASCSERVG